MACFAKLKQKQLFRISGSGDSLKKKKKKDITAVCVGQDTPYWRQKGYRIIGY